MALSTTEGGSEIPFRSCMSILATILTKRSSFRIIWLRYLGRTVVASVPKAIDEGRVVEEKGVNAVGMLGQTLLIA